MKKTVFALALAAVLATAGGAAAQMKIATADLDRVFSAHPKVVAAEAGLKASEKEIKADLEKLLEQGNALEEEIQKLRNAASSPMLSEAARIQKRSEAEEKVTTLQELQLRIRRTQETRMKQLRDQLMKTRQGIVDEMMAVVKEYAEEEGFDLVLDKSGLTMNAVPLVVWSSAESDITEELIRRTGGTEKAADAEEADAADEE